jgi:sucrose-6F-phosphate phosphohydrolase
MTTLITDIDGTLLGNPEGLESLNRHLTEHRKSFFLVYATGRDLAEYEAVSKPSGLLEPDALILNTGSDIYEKNTHKYKLDSEWHRHLEPGWDLGRIDAFMRNTGLIIPQNKSHPFKLSYFLTGPVPDSIEEDLKDQFLAEGMKAHPVSSMGTYLDIMPAHCNKGEAAIYLIKKHGIKPKDVIVAGDSENDYELFARFDRGILVANAQERLISKLYGRNHYRAKNGHAAGVLEGLLFYAGH